MFDANRALEPAFQEQPLVFFWQSIVANYAVDEEIYLRKLMVLAQSDAAELKVAAETGSELIRKVREQSEPVHMIDALLQEYRLDTQEGILLMCLAEALMRIPDKRTAEALIRDKMTDADWNRHLGRSGSTLVNASTWGLILTGRVVKMDQQLDGSPSTIWMRLVKRSGEPVIRRAMSHAMAIIGRQFVLGRDIGEALDNTASYRRKGYAYSFDLLGESAMTAEDAAGHYSDYRHAIAEVGKQAAVSGKALPPSVSIKLSALHPRYDALQECRVLDELFPTLCDLVGFARERGVAVTLDAEEMDCLELSLKLFERVFRAPVAEGWSGLGLAVQAYSKRALPVLCWLNRLAKEQGDEIPVRLVKGAYWDNEIKHAQELGIEHYPVFTRKEGTDTSYLACLRFLLSDYTKGALYPQLASHNAQTVASVLAIARQKTRRLELQRLHGMGEALYESVMKEHDIPVRIYAPVGGHKELLPYLIRRLLENGANSSFVHRLVNAATPVDSLVQNPVQELQKYRSLADDRIPAPPGLYGSERVNARGWNLRVAAHREPLLESFDQWLGHYGQAGPVIDGETCFEGDARKISVPADPSQTAGELHWADLSQVDRALSCATLGFAPWSERPVAERAGYLLQFASLVEERAAELTALCCKEVGRSLPEGIEEIRATVDICRYYASQGQSRFGHPVALAGPTGETRELYMDGRGVCVCISAASSPLSVLCGQVAAALIAGNSVVAKPAEQASLIAHRAVELMLQAGVPGNVIQLLPGDGPTIGSALIRDARVAAVAFTGSARVARLINLTLAEREDALVPLIAATGGWNAMIADSSALPEQVVRDVLKSAFAGAGQRYSALRLLYLQQDVADNIERLLAGAIDQLSVGDPAGLDTDIGPLASAQVTTDLEQHIEWLENNARLIGKAGIADNEGSQFFIAPSAWEIKSVKYLKNDCFAPILYIVRYSAEALNEVIDDINSLGTGLTLGIHSRSQSTAADIERRVKVRNTYINRDQTGVSTGTGSSGPNYLLRFAAERTRTINTTAMGGNASLLSLGIERV